MHATDAPVDALRPRDAADLEEIVRGRVQPLEPVGGGTKRAVGRPVDADVLDLSALDGIVDYVPAELVLTARAATPLAAVEQLLAAERQRLPFEPPNLCTLLGGAGAATLGGALAANLSGSRRVSAGAARDCFLGCTAVDGRGRLFTAGGKVVKNVTGFDLPKLLAGSWGTLAVMTEVTVRVAPAAETERTLIVSAATPAQAAPLLAAALGSPSEVSAAGFDPQRGCALRIEGFAASLRARAAALLEVLGRPAEETLEEEASRALWAEWGGAAALARWPVVWRISVPPSDAPRLVEAIAPQGYLLDWGGGLVWAAFAEVDAAHVRAALHAGHATLFKAPVEQRATVPVFHPQPPALAALGARVKAAFDPANKLNRGRMQ